MRHGSLRLCTEWIAPTIGNFSCQVAPTYLADRVFGKKSDTNDVYDYSGKPLVQSVLQGFNGTVFCYGQTAAGKTYTMMGDDAAPGFLRLALQ